MKDDSDSKDDTEELERQLNKTNSDFKAMREMFNQNAAALSELQEQACKNQDLEKEVATLQAAANVISAPVEGRERLKLNTPSTFDRTLGQLKGHLIEIAYRFTPSVDDSSSEEEPDDQEGRIKQLLRY
ncbi:hypothetical protein CGCA056_v008653 [Colletotrichum aenigma]|uniref:uncharacterized protein n=1 Tax=Colletotrichum aenigma TaxID=1215731 RepID=UPI001872B413|nr:uncharacterized protein CGCA056_v008653 [Colletotrichum aenigma]KAF5520491.1 hypothetical protein CGCA056_v008653 [Colletotrichum aenigma]